MKKLSMILILAIVMAVTFSACTMHIGVRGVTGSGNVVSETREVSGFDRVQLDGVGQLILTQADTESLEISAEDNLVERITTEVRAGTLYIGWQDQDWDNFVTPTRPIIFRLNVKELTGLEVNGATEIEAQQLTADTLDLEVNGAGKVDIKALSVDHLNVKFSGGATCELAGKATRMDIDISGAGKLDAADLESQMVNVEASGAATLTVWAVESLDVKVDGAVNLGYYGDPTVHEDVSGVSNINKLGNK